MSEHGTDAKALKVAKTLKNADNWKHLARWNGEGYYELQTEDTGDVPVRLFLTPTLFKEAEDIRTWHYRPTGKESVECCG